MTQQNICIARITIDLHGTYYADIPMLDSDGVWRMGTVSMGPGVQPRELLELVSNKLSSPEVQEQIGQAMMSGVYGL